MNRRSTWLGAAFVFALNMHGALAIDIPATRFGAFGLPEVNVVLRPSAGSPPYEGFDVLIDDPLVNLRMVFDSGASGVILGKEPAQQIGIPFATSAGADVLFEDVGIGGSTTFEVSDPVHMSLGQFTQEPPNEFDPATGDTTHPRQYPSVRLQLGPPCTTPPNCLFTGVIGRLSLSGVVGMPAMLDKISVIQPKLAESFLDTIHTHVYDPALAPETGPGILIADLHVELTLKSFDRFTRVTPSGASGPTLEVNPFIGPNPLAELEGQSAPGGPPGITVSFNGKETLGSFLLDTGGQISSISTATAAKLNVRYRENCTEACPKLETFDPQNPENPGTPIPNQFSFAPTGIGGSETLAGFYLDALLIKTREGNVSDDNDPYHINFAPAPVFVQDIELEDPLTGETFIFDGVFGMNFLMASIDTASPSTIQPGAFDALILDFDSTSSNPPQLGLLVTEGIALPPAQAGKQVPLPTFALLLLAGILSAVAAVKYTRR